MSKIRRESANAFLNDHGEFKRANTEVVSTSWTYTDGRRVNQSNFFLYGKKIAYRRGMLIVFTMAGWPTQTTKDRLNGIFVAGNNPFHLYTEDKKVYLGWLPSIFDSRVFQRVLVHPSETLTLDRGTNTVELPDGSVFPTEPPSRLDW